MIRLDFGYPWWLTYGHIVILLPAVLLLVLAFRRRWPIWSVVSVGLLVLWSGAGIGIARFLFDPDGVPALPTQNFLRAGKGHVLDMGAGTGRSSIMVLTARPEATLVALDLFGKSFEQHFGESKTPEQKLLANLQAAGVSQRATIHKADMRSLPFEPATFDAIVSAYAIDHLTREGVGQTVSEAHRVLKPGGDFLLILIGKEPWGHFAYGPLFAHFGSRNPDWWRTRLQEANFQVREQRTQPLTLYFLAHRQ